VEEEETEEEGKVEALLSASVFTAFASVLEGRDPSGFGNVFGSTPFW